MKNIIQIFKNDVKNIVKRRASIVVIIALMILPSMYAWFNILPSWDPYANTEDVAVAVVNLDKGADLNGEKINVGEEVTTSLKANKKLGWQFVTKEEAEKGVEKGDYYASIIIPENFSRKLISVLDDEPEKPVLSYYINEKINAIAPKVTGAGASGMVESIQSGFVKVANEAIFSVFNDVGIELEANQQSILRLQEAIYQLEKELPEIERLLGVAGEDLDRVGDASGKAHNGLKRAEEASEEVQALSVKIHALLEETDGYVNQYVPIVQQDLEKAQEAIGKIPTIIQKVSDKEQAFEDVLEKVEQQTGKIDDGVTALSKLEALLLEADQEAANGEQMTTLIQQLEAEEKQLEQAKKDVEKAIEALENAEEIPSGGIGSSSEQTRPELEVLYQAIDSRQNIIRSLMEASEELQQSIDNGLFVDGAGRVGSYEEQLTQFQEEINAAVERAKKGKETAGETLDHIEEQAIRLEKTVAEVDRFIEKDLLPLYRQEMSTAKKALDEADEKVANVISYFPKAAELLDKLDDGVAIGQEELHKVNDLFPEAEDKIIELASKIRSLDEKGDLAELIQFLRNDATVEGEFFADPIVLEEQQLFPIPNYGSAMAPFFTAMSLWVGGLILVSSLIVDVPNKARYKSYEAYFGRFLTFWLIGLMQALIVMLGNLFILKTFVAHQLIYILFGFLISTTFIIMIYTLVSVFGNTGKVIAIILLVMQLGASGGTFPIQMTPSFFQQIHAFLPFTHALQLFREAVGGIIWSVALKHISWLVGYMVVFMFIGIKLKAVINKRSDKFLEEARESEIIL